MPELKNTFTQGKMNKDLDERLIPNGQYRDAMNVQVSTSEGSDIGTVQNILGNLQVDQGIVGSNFRCIGSIAEEKTNTIYWFVTSSNVDAILEYEKDKTAKLVFVDTKAGTADAVLNFTNKIITGINIVDDMLFFTDNLNEPKKINIPRCKQGTQDINTHTKLVVNGKIVQEDDGTGTMVDVDITEDHITVIKKRPKRAPDFKLNFDPNVPKPGLFEKKFIRFACRYKYEDGEYSAFGPFTDVVFSPKYTDDYNVDNAFSTKEPYNAAMLNHIASVELCNFIPPDIPEDVVQIDILYSQENSPVVYSIASIKSDEDDFNADGYSQGSSSATGYKGKYTITSENVYAAIPENQLLRSWDNVPIRALSQEVTGSRIVYGNYTQNYNLGLDGHDEPIKPGLNVNFDLRKNISDFQTGGLPSVKSQRNYQLGVVFGDKYGRETPVFTSTDGAIKIPWVSSLGKSASISTQLTAKLTSEAPSWANYYKFYIKETSGEYYNLVMDKAYVPTHEVDEDYEDPYLWLSFNSSDRNKLKEEDYVILKKKIGVGEVQIGEENRLKVIDISNEAPDAIKFRFDSVALIANIDDVLSNTSGDPDDPGIMFDEDFRIDRQADEIHIHKTNLEGPSNNGLNLFTEDSSDNAVSDGDNLYISWQDPSTGQASTRYRVVSARVSNGNVYMLKLANEISEVDTLIASSNPGQVAGTAGALTDGLILKIERKQLKDLDEFSGRFFVKVVLDQTTSNISQYNLISQIADDYVISAHAEMFWLHDTLNSTNNTNSGGLVNGYAFQNQGDTTVKEYLNDFFPTGFPNGAGTDLTDDRAQWNLLAEGPVKNEFFIDNMGFVAGQMDPVNSYAKTAVDPVHGVGWQYGKQVWTNLRANGNINPGGYRWFPQDMDEDSYNEVGGVFHYVPVPNPNPSQISTFLGPGGDDYDTGNNFVNGMEGIMQSGSFPEHLKNSFGSGPFTLEQHPRRGWRVPGPYVDNEIPHATDDTYGPADGASGRHFIHLSFLAPGVNLHNNSGYSADNTALSGFQRKGKNGLGKNLQGIWGGGVFVREDGGRFYTTNSTPAKAERVVEMEGNYEDFPAGLASFTSNTQGAFIFGSSIFPTPGANGGAYNHAHTSGKNNVIGYAQEDAPGPGTGIGYDTTYQDDHENQWNPAYGRTASEANKINSFLANLVQGAKFTFSDDEDDTVYTILNSPKQNAKRLYNHTPWRRRYIWDGTDYVFGGDSVEEAVIDWSDSQTNAWTGGGVFESTIVKARIKRFGEAANRRICYIIEVDKDPTIASGNYNPIGGSSVAAGDDVDEPDANTSTKIQFLQSDPRVITGKVSKQPAIWETEPKEVADLDIYYETNSLIPTKLNEKTREVFAPVGCKVEFPGSTVALNGSFAISGDIFLQEWYTNPAGNMVVRLNPGVNYADPNGDEINYGNAIFKFIREDGSFTSGRVAPIMFTPAGQTLTAADYRKDFVLTEIVDTSLDVGLSWHNCFSFGNGVESNRIRDDFNEMRILNGPRASTTTEEPYQEETRKHGLIYSGLYNSNSGINNLNQFITAEKITKDLNPTFGSIQKLFQRRASLIAFCEDRVINILSNRDALFNADGNPQLLATDRVLGDATPFVGDFGISKNPESFSKESYRAYFADKQRGAVLRLSNDGLTPISDAGMHDFFRDNLPDAGQIIGSYDEFKKDYNLTLTTPILKNLFTNADISEGLLSVETIPSVEVIQNGGINQGVELQMPSIDPNNMDVSNGEIESETTITNHPAIPTNTLLPETNLPATITYNDSVFVHGGGYNMFTNSLTDSSEAGDAFAPYNFSTNISAGPNTNNKTFLTRKGSVGVIETVFGGLDGIFDVPASGNGNYTNQLINLGISSAGPLSTAFANSDVFHDRVMGAANNYVGKPNIPIIAHDNTNSNSSATVAGTASGLQGIVFRTYGSKANHLEVTGQGNFYNTPGYTYTNSMQAYIAFRGYSSSNPINGGYNTIKRYGSVSSNVLNWNPTNPNALPVDASGNYDPNGVIPNYSVATGGTDVNNLTIFNGEEIKIQFKARAAVPDAVGAYAHQEDGSNAGGVYSGSGGGLFDLDSFHANHGNGRAGFHVKLIDRTGTVVAAGSTIPADYIHVPNGGNYDASQLPYNSISYTAGNGNLQGGSTLAVNGNTAEEFTYDFYKGFQDKATVTFPYLPRHNSINTDYFEHQVFFKFTDPNAPNQEKIIIQDLEVRIYFKTGWLSELHEVWLKDLSITKAYALETPQSITVTPGTPLPGVPTVDIPAWAEVQHNTSDWSTTNNDPDTSLHQRAIDTYGPATGQGTNETESSITYLIPPGFDIANPSNYTANNSLTFYNDGTGGSGMYGVSPDITSITNLASGSSLTMADITALNTTTTLVNNTGLKDAIYISTTGSEYITQPITSTPFVPGNWYMVDLIADSATFGTGNNVIAAFAVLDNAITSPLNAGDAGYPEHHYGGVRGGAGGVRSMKLIPATNTEYGTGISGSGESVYRAIFQFSANSQTHLDGNNNQLKLLFNDFEGTIDEIRLIEITPPSTGGTPDSWSIDNLNNLNQVHSLTEPLIYYKNNAINWNTTDGVDKVVKQEFIYGSSPVASVDGFKLKFTVSEAVDGYGNNLPIAGTLKSIVSTSFDNTLATPAYEGLVIDSIDTAGEHEVDFNFDGVSAGWVKKLDGAITTAFNLGVLTTLSSSNNGTNPVLANQIRFYPDYTSGFVGAISGVSLIDKTNFFSGGSANAWSFSGFNTGLDDYITFNAQGQNILFQNAPETDISTVQVEQVIPNVIFEDEYFRIKFDFNLTSGTINGYYFNHEGKGFRLGSISATGSYDALYRVGTEIVTASDPELRNTFVIFVETEFVTGTLDNLVMQQEFPFYEEKTITYNEGVKGWVSFKSFIPEQGVSIAKKYYTVKQGALWQHHINQNRNTFYGYLTESSVTALLNESPSIVKTFNTLNYEGSKSKINKYIDHKAGSTLDTYNSKEKQGWYVDLIKTDKQEGTIKEFIEKEGKWFNYIRGSVSDIKTSDFSFQGLGIINDVSTGSLPSSGGGSGSSGSGGSSTSY